MDTTVTEAARALAEAKFWARVDRSGECWLWTGPRTFDGYGQLYFEGRNHRAHRLAFLFEYGRWPTPMALHLCNNPSCVRPKHIVEGTNAENMAHRRRARPTPIESDLAVVVDLQLRLGISDSDMSQRLGFSRGLWSNVIGGHLRFTDGHRFRLLVQFPELRSYFLP